MSRPPILGRWVRDHFPTREFMVCCTPLPGMILYGWAYRDLEMDWVPKDMGQFREYDAVCRYLGRLWPQVDWEDSVCKAAAQTELQRIGKGTKAP